MNVLPTKNPHHRTALNIKTRRNGATHLAGLLYLALQERPRALDGSEEGTRGGLQGEVGRECAVFPEVRGGGNKTERLGI